MYCLNYLDRQSKIQLLSWGSTWPSLQSLGAVAGRKHTTETRGEGVSTNINAGGATS